MVVCNITFDDNKHGIYFAGQTLTGKVTIQSDKVIKVKGIYLKIKGYAKVLWDDDSLLITINDGKKSKSLYSSDRFYANEVYLSSNTFLLGSDNSASSVLNEPGEHTYSFACNIPANCPSSFEGFYGHIRYKVKVELIRPWIFDQTYTKVFTVLKAMNLNDESSLMREPVSSEGQKKFDFGSSEPLKLHASVPQSGYVPGQTIPVSVLVTNDSGVTVQEMKIELYMVTHFHSQKPYRGTINTRTVVAKLKGDSVMRQCRKMFTYNITVPSTPSTSFKDCSIIDISYVIQVEAKVNGLHRNHVITLPVTIGNVPLLSLDSKELKISKNTQDEQETSGASTSAKAHMAMGNGTNSTNKSDVSNDGLPTFLAVSDMTTLNSLWAADASIAPPSYEEAVHMTRTKLNDVENHKCKENDFAPRYPVFDMPEPTALNEQEMESARSSNASAQFENVAQKKAAKYK